MIAAEGTIELSGLTVKEAREALKSIRALWSLAKVDIIARGMWEEIGTRDPIHATCGGCEILDLGTKHVSLKADEEVCRAKPDCYGCGNDKGTITIKARF